MQIQTSIARHRKILVSFFKIVEISPFIHNLQLVRFHFIMAADIFTSSDNKVKCPLIQNVGSSNKGADLFIIWLMSFLFIS